MKLEADPGRAISPRGTVAVAVVILISLIAALVVVSSGTAKAQAPTSAKCKNGKAAGYFCKNIDLVGYVDAGTMGGAGVAVSGVGSIPRPTRNTRSWARPAGSSSST